MDNTFIIVFTIIMLLSIIIVCLLTFLLPKENEKNTPFEVKLSRKIKGYNSDFRTDKMQNNIKKLNLEKNFEFKR